MIRIAIAEDEKVCADQLQQYLRRYREEKDTELSVTVFSDGLDLVEHYQPDWDILLLDIEMPHLDGMTAARKIREMDASVTIIFITNMAKYAIRGYEVDALDFVLKPVSYFAFATKLTKAISAIRRTGQASIVFQYEGGVRRLMADEVRYVEVADHWLHIHTESGTYTSLGTLKEMEKQLERYCFFRCNKCYLVNLRHVIHMRGNTVTLSGGQELQISRPRKKDFQLALMNYYGGGMR